MKNKSTLFLKLVVIFISIPVLALCIFWLPKVARYLNLPIVFGAYTTALAYFFALYQALKLLNYIDKNVAFSTVSVKTLKYIKYCGITISVIYTLLVPLLYPIAEADDAPGLVGFPVIIIFASIVISTFAAVLEKLLQDALDIKRDNDLTIWGE